MKKVWARIGVAVTLSDKDFEELKEAMKQGDSAKSVEILVSSESSLEGDSYIPADIEGYDNPNEEEFTLRTRESD